MTREQIVKTLSGNTVQLKGAEAYGLVKADGKLKGLNTPRGGRTGEWRVSDNDVLCAKWYEVKGSTEECDVMPHLGASVVVAHPPKPVKPLI